jgi:hypothetical protein
VGGVPKESDGVEVLYFREEAVSINLAGKFCPSVNPGFLMVDSVLVTKT